MYTITWSNRLDQTVGTVRDQKVPITTLLVPDDMSCEVCGAFWWCFAHYYLPHGKVIFSEAFVSHSVHRGTGSAWGGVCPWGGLPPEGPATGGSASRGGRSLHAGGSASKDVCIGGGLHHPGGSASWRGMGSASRCGRGSVSRGSASGGLHLGVGGLSLGAGIWIQGERDLHPGDRDLPNSLGTDI